MHRPAPAEMFFDDTTEPMEAAVANEKFITELKKVSQLNDPGLMAAMVAKYSEKFEDTDPAKSVELLIIAENILADAK